MDFQRKNLSPPGFEPGTDALEVQRANPLRHEDYAHFRACFTAN